MERVYTNVEVCNLIDEAVATMLRRLEIHPGRVKYVTAILFETFGLDPTGEALTQPAKA